jgi:putative ABC transport system permease protein
VSPTSRALARQFTRHPRQGLLCVLGIALGVAVVLAIDLALDSSRRAFELGATKVAGRATHRVVPGGARLDEALYARLRRQTGAALAPLLEADALLEVGTRTERFRLLGVDPFAERPFRPELDLGGGPRGRLDAFLTEPGAVLMLEATARDLGLARGERFRLVLGSRPVSVRLAGTFSPASEEWREGTSRLLVCDLATAQELLRAPGALHRIDAICADDTEAKELANRLPPGVRLVPASARKEQLARMLDAFDLNLSFLGGLALLVGAFLIFNTLTFAVVRSRPILGRLRCHGVTGPEIVRAVLLLGAALGALGSAVGVLFGLALGRGLIDAVAATINDHYLVLAVSEWHVTPFSVLKAVTLGVATSTLVALLPAREAMRVPPRQGLARSDLEDGARRRAPRLLVRGGALVALAIGILALPSRSLIPLHVGLLLLVLGAACGTPAFTLVLSGLLRPLARRLFGLPGALATGSVARDLSRTAVAIGSLAVALSMVIGVGLMVSSFRGTVSRWLDRTLRADVYVSLPGGVAQNVDQPRLPPELVEGVRALPGAATTTLSLSTHVESERGRVRVLALDLPDRRTFVYQALEISDDAAWEALQRGEMLVSEPFGWRHGLGADDRLLLEGHRGPESFRIAGTFRDFASDRGYAIVSARAWAERLGAPGATAVGLYAAEGISGAELAARARALAPELRLDVDTSGALKDTSLRIFDRTFRVTEVLRLLAAIVAAVGMLSALMALHFERAREMAILRCRGLSARQLRGMVLGQSTVMGLAAGLLALPLGLAFAYVLTTLVNKRSFGWTLPFEVEPAPLLLGVLLALGASLAAAIWPAVQLSRTPPARALRHE